MFYFVSALLGLFLMGSGMLGFWGSVTKAWKFEDDEAYIPIYILTGFATVLGFIWFSIAVLSGLA